MVVIRRMVGGEYAAVGKLGITSRNKLLNYGIFGFKNVFISVVLVERKGKDIFFVLLAVNIVLQFFSGFGPARKKRVVVHIPASRSDKVGNIAVPEVFLARRAVGRTCNNV